MTYNDNLIPQISACPVCKTGIEPVERYIGGIDVVKIMCPNCGRFSITETVLVPFSESDHKDPDLCFAIRTRSDRGEEVTVDSGNRGEILSGIKIPTSVKDIAELILIKAYQSEDSSLILSMENSLRFGIKSRTKMQFVIRYFKDAGWFDIIDLGDGGGVLTITGEGIRRAEDIFSPNHRSTQVFVAMSYKQSLEIVYTEAIKAAVQSCQLDALRIDEHSFNDEILKNIQEQIDRSKFIIADLTYNSPGVYYEAGYAAGRNIPVIYCCRESDKENIHFDINHFNFIVWSDSEGLKKSLIKRITDTGLMR